MNSNIALKIGKNSGARLLNLTRAAVNRTSKIQTIELGERIKNQIVDAFLTR